MSSIPTLLDETGGSPPRRPSTVRHEACSLLALMRTPIVRRFSIVLGCCLLPTCILERQATAAPCPPEQTGNATIVRTDDVELDHGFPAGLPDTVEKAREDVFVPANAWEELDDIYGLMALAVVHADWQEPRPKGLVRGHNIGGVLVDETLEVVDWERNRPGGSRVRMRRRSISGRERSSRTTRCASAPRRRKCGSWHRGPRSRSS